MTTPPHLPPGLIITRALPRICPQCGCEALTIEERAPRWFKVTCQRGDPRVCQWVCQYEVRTEMKPLEGIRG